MLCWDTNILIFLSDPYQRKVAVCDEDKKVVETFQSAATSSGSDLVYAVDENGQQIALGIVFDGPFEPQAISSPREASWLGGEEVCVTSERPEVNEDYNINCEVKEEKEDSAEIKAEDFRSKNENSLSEAVKVYKIGPKSKKTLSQMKNFIEMKRKLSDIKTKKCLSKAQKKIKQTTKKGKLSQLNAAKRISKVSSSMTKTKAKKEKVDKVFHAPAYVRSDCTVGKGNEITCTKSNLIMLLFTVNLELCQFNCSSQEKWAC